MPEDPPPIVTSVAYREPITVALIWQGVVGLLVATFLDGGHLAAVTCAAVAGFWIGAAAIVLRRRMDPRRSDLFLIKWGFPILWLAAVTWAAVGLTPPPGVR